MIVYVSGPMTGYIDFNREAFARATAFLRAQGHIVVNPAEYDAEVDESQMTHADYLRRDVRLLLDCTHIYLLPGWAHSKGATLETRVADGCGVERFRVPGDDDIWRTFEGEPLDEPVPEDAPNLDDFEDDGLIGDVLRVRVAEVCPYDGCTLAPGVSHIHATDLGDVDPDPVVHLMRGRGRD